MAEVISRGKVTRSKLRRVAGHQPLHKRKVPVAGPMGGAYPAPAGRTRHLKKALRSFGG